MSSNARLEQFPGFPTSLRNYHSDLHGTAINARHHHEVLGKIDLTSSIYHFGPYVRVGVARGRLRWYGRGVTHLPIHVTVFSMNRSTRLLIAVLIAINVGIYILWNYGQAFGVSPEFMAENFLISWLHLEDGRYWTLLASAFSHNLLLHIVLNMMVLNSFGPIVAHTLGARRFLLFYLAAGLIGSLAHALVSNFLIGDGRVPALGASGAISGVILLFSLLFPRQKILLFAFIPVPAILGAIIFMGLDIWGVIAQSQGGGLPIGHGAHLGGALTGLAYYFILRSQLRKQIV